jgi:hypothetical protein
MKVLFLSLGLSALCLSLYQCTTSDTTPLNTKKDLPEKILVDGNLYAGFVSNVVSEFEKLTVDQKSIVGKFTSSEEKKSKTAKFGGGSAVCECHPDDRSCSASGATSDCCICCPRDRAATCGTYFGLASCKCEGAANRSEINPKTVTFYPQKFAQMLVFAKSKGINVIALETHFNKFMSLLAK